LKVEYLPATFTELENSAWITGWPLQNESQENTVGLPAAVRGTFDTLALGKVVRIFALTVVDNGN
jgi:hypothetical protein